VADKPSVPEDARQRTGEHLPDSPPPQQVAAPAAETTTGAPRWVKVLGIVGALLVLLIIVMLLTGHGPGRHMHGGLGGPVAPASLDTGVATRGGFA
jgi:hypothetical protein